MSWIINTVGTSNNTSGISSGFSCIKPYNPRDMFGMPASDWFPQPQSEPDLTKLTKLKDALKEYNEINEKRERRITTKEKPMTNKVLVEYEMRILYLGPEPLGGMTRNVTYFRDYIEGAHDADFKTLAVMKNSKTISEKAENYKLDVADFHIDFREVHRWGIKDKKKD